jgi:hypothetical protein
LKSDAFHFPPSVHFQDLTVASSEFEYINNVNASKRETGVFSVNMDVSFYKASFVHIEQANIVTQYTGNCNKAIRDSEMSSYGLLIGCQRRVSSSE